MRLYEVAGNQFVDDLANVLKVMQGRADTKRTTSMIPWPAVNNLIKNYGYGSVDQDMLTKIRDQLDPSDSLIQDITDAGIVLKTKMGSLAEPKATPGMPSSKTVDQMAHNTTSREFG